VLALVVPRGALLRPCWVVWSCLMIGDVLAPATALAGAPPAISGCGWGGGPFQGCSVCSCWLGSCCCDGYSVLLMG
jgi:hypothetical protein